MYFVKWFVVVVYNGLWVVDLQYFFVLYQCYLFILRSFVYIGCIYNNGDLVSFELGEYILKFGVIYCIYFGGWFVEK